MEDLGFDPEESARRANALFCLNARQKNNALMDELYQAKHQISTGRGRRENGDEHITWDGYCQEAFNGTPTRRTVDNWLRQYEKDEIKRGDPEEIPVDTLFLDKTKKHPKGVVMNPDGTITVYLSLPGCPNPIAKVLPNFKRLA
jgi:hypothetical protein